jgi:transcription antitermination factor NusG
LSPLFPSYLFVHKKADKVVEIIKRNFADEFIRPLCFKEKERKCKVCFQETSPCMVAEHEMDFFLSAADTTGVISLSCGIQKENEIKIVNGPLKYLNNKIIWINQKKKKACVEVELFKQKMKVNLGFEMLDVS